MTMDPQALYLQLGQLIAEMPDLAGNAPITPEVNRWLGRAVHLIRESGSRVDSIGLAVACDNMIGPMREMNVQKIMAIVYRALARAEANAPAAARGGFIGVGAALDALQLVASVLAEAKRDILIVDAYMDGKVFTDFAPQAPAGVNVRLLADSFYTKPGTLAPFATRWGQQYGTERPLDVRLSPARALHDRLIQADGARVWSLTQSLKDIAGRSPALLQRVDADIAEKKVDFYERVWGESIPFA